MKKIKLRPRIRFKTLVLLGFFIGIFINSKGEIKYNEALSSPPYCEQNNCAMLPWYEQIFTQKSAKCDYAINSESNCDMAGSSCFTQGCWMQ
jgi:hypothetical protein